MEKVRFKIKYGLNRSYVKEVSARRCKKIFNLIIPIKYENFHQFNRLNRHQTQHQNQYLELFQHDHPYQGDMQRNQN